jgi:hypothetical protein
MNDPIPPHHPVTASVEELEALLAQAKRARRENTKTAGQAQYDENMRKGRERARLRELHKPVAAANERVAAARAEVRTCKGLNFFMHPENRARAVAADEALEEAMRQASLALATYNAKKGGTP